MPVVPQSARLVVTYSGQGGATAANVLHFRSVGGDFDQAAGDAILGNWGIFWQQLACSDWTLDATAQWLDLSVDPPEELIAVNATIGGDGGSDALPAQVAFCLSLNAGPGRSRKGRIYIPGIGEGDVTDQSKVSGAFVTLAVDEFFDFANQCFTDAEWVPAVYSRTLGVTNVITGAGGDEVIDTQRRRVQRLA